MRIPHRSALLLPLLLLLACSDRPRGATADTSPAAQRPPFRADSAFALLERQVAFGPRIPNTAPHQAQLEWMRTYLAARADTVMAQTFTHTAADGQTLRLTNLFARFRPELSDRVLLLTHWDTRPRSDEAKSREERAQPVPGANDGASGTAVLLQLADLFGRQAPPIGVDLLFVDGEDYGPGERDMYLGANHFAANLPAGYPPLYGVLLDMVGDRTPHFPVEGYSAEQAPEVVQRLWGMARELGYGEVFPYRTGPFIDDDHLPLNRAGVRTVDVIDFDYGPGNRYWHTPQDIPENTGPAGLQAVGDALAELIYRGG